MSDKYHGGAGIKAGKTSVSAVIRLLSTAGAAVTGKVYSDLTAYYWRQGGSPTAISLSALAAINSAYASGGVKEADATNMPGLYRLDLPDAMLATGADWVALVVKCSGAMDYAVFLPLESVGDSENYERVGAPAGASVSADIAAVLAAVTAIVAAVWAYATRTLTQSAASVAAAVEGDEITVYKGASWSIALTGLGTLTGYTKIWFTVKSALDDTDAQALLQIGKYAAGSDGLRVLNGAAYGTAAHGSITLNDQSAGNLTIVLDEVASALLDAGEDLYYDVKMLNGGTVTVLADGQAGAQGLFNILASATASYV